MLTTEEFLNFVLKPDKSNVRLKINTYYNSNPDIKLFIDTYYPGKSVTEAAYIIVYDVKETPCCRTCGKPLKFDNFIHGYRTYCSKSCSAKDKNPIQTVPDRIIDKQEVIDTFYGPDGKLIEQRCLTAYLKKNGWYNPLMNYYTDSDSCEETIYRIARDINEKPRCKTCGKPLKFHHEFRTFCSQQCANKDIDVCIKNSESVSKALIKAYIERGDEIKEKRKRTLSEKYNIDLESSSPLAIPEIQESIKIEYPSQIERDFIAYLDKHFPNAYEFQYKSKKYPFYCDFYIIPLDLYIEIQGTWMHGGKPYEETAEDNKKREHWANLNTPQYKKAIHVWCESDVEKRLYAKAYNLNYLEIFSYNIYHAIKIFENYIKEHYNLESPEI
ncbi:MAG: homing endonuclease [Wendovervirus sonii]|uniref:Homing endonuclease n=1 Tax=phage Lak_Megaphage_Sonny TaxID=3109229 RepID=A0ABZ0Z5I7_9CAUD|nr:MAG: homing endonuclease [phage Lak_Megaphage_Sonny]